MRPVTRPIALLGASFLALSISAARAQDGIVRSETFPPTAGKRTQPVTLEEARAILQTLKEVPAALAGNLHQALDVVSRSPRTARSLERDVSVALAAMEQLRREALEPFRATKGFPASELASFDRELDDVRDLARTVNDDLESHEGTFIRGDANGDGRLDLSDALHTLGFLYLGGPGADCQAAADANDDEAVDVSDAVGTLSSLFLTSRPLPPPSGEPGLDPTPGLGCAVGLDTADDTAGGGGALRQLGPIHIDQGIRVNCYWVCLFVCTPNWCWYYCYSICVIH